MRAYALVSTFLVAATFVEPRAQDRPEPSSLVGLKGVFLRVQADRGLESSITAGSEAKLRAAGVTTFAKSDWDSTADVGLLNLDVAIRCERDEVSCGYSVLLKIRQHAQLTRSPRTALVATTWQNGYTGSITKARLSTLPDLIAVDAGTLILNFAADYRSANPK